jgi:hypothetical protein
MNVFFFISIFQNTLMSCYNQQEQQTKNMYFFFILQKI